MGVLAILSVSDRAAVPHQHVCIVCPTRPGDKIAAFRKGTGTWFSCIAAQTCVCRLAAHEPVSVIRRFLCKRASLACGSPSHDYWSRTPIVCVLELRVSEKRKILLALIDPPLERCH